MANALEMSSLKWFNAVAGILSFLVSAKAPRMRLQPCCPALFLYSVCPTVSAFAVQ